MSHLSQSPSNFKAQFCRVELLPMEENDNWEEVSDWDDPLQVAYLFHDWNSSQCGHAVPWNPHRLLKLKSCPICHQPISLIQQGPFSPSDTPSILFKYGKHIYRLFVLPPDPSLPTSSSSSSSRSSSSTSWWWFSRLKISQQPKQQQHPVLVQDRIQQALQLADGFKILHKGKIIYPIPSSSSSSSTKARTFPTSTTVTTTTSAEEQVSELLLQLSSPSLLLMGTILGQEWSLPKSSPPPGPQSHGIFMTFWQLFQWPGSLLYSTLHSVWALVMTSSSWTTSLSTHALFLRGPGVADTTPSPTTTSPTTTTATTTTAETSPSTGSSATTRPSHHHNRPHAD